MAGNVNFYLKAAEKSTGKSLIYLKFKYNGKVLVFSFGQSVNPKDWNTGKQRVKSNKQTTANGDHSLNELLDNLEEVCLNCYKSELANGIPQPEVLKRYLVAFINQNEKDEDAPNLYKLIDRFINGEIKYQGKDKTKSTLGKYSTIKGHLREFETKQRYRMDFDTINLDFFYKYVSFLQAKGLAQNTIAKNIQIIKVFMNEAVDLGFTSNMQFKNKKFSASWEDTDAVYLTDKELIHLFNHDFSENKKLEQVRDLFIFGCYTGLRFSDYSDVKPQNIISVDGETFIKIITKKTKSLAIIPCNPIIQKIFKKYSNNPNKLPRAISNQKFNEYIKEACEDVELTEPGRLSTDPDLPLYKSITSHTARRSFATNLYLEGFPTIEIMKITGHTTEKSFLTYIKVSKLDAAKKLSKHIQLRWSEKIMKVAS
jgi:integrase